MTHINYVHIHFLKKYVSLLAKILINCYLCNRAIHLGVVRKANTQMPPI